MQDFRSQAQHPAEQANFFPHFPGHPFLLLLQDYCRDCSPTPPTRPAYYQAVLQHDPGEDGGRDRPHRWDDRRLNCIVQIDEASSGDESSTVVDLWRDTGFSEVSTKRRARPSSWSVLVTGVTRPPSYRSSCRSAARDHHHRGRLGCLPEPEPARLHPLRSQPHHHLRGSCYWHSH